jgi:DNA-binding LacI/PurR family transcriptional regulator
MPHAVPDRSSPPFTLRLLAQAAGVSQMTVSRALSGRGRVAADTRSRITALASKHGYRPDPEVSKLMHHLRTRRTRRFQSVVVGLTSRRPDDREPYFQSLVAGARAQLSSSGYGFEVLQISLDGKGPVGLERILRARGIEGVLVLPQKSPVDLTGLLPWRDFVVVAASASAVVPGAHRVTPDHFANTVLLCRKLTADGRRRIGLVIDADHDRRTNHGFSAAVTWHGLNEAGHFVPPLVTAGTSSVALLKWFNRERPDTIVTNEFASAQACARLLRRSLSGSVRFVVTSRTTPAKAELSGIDERPAAIGAAAVDLLTAMIERRARHDSSTQVSTLLAGRWVE